jgi:hypothetical protein
VQPVSDDGLRVVEAENERFAIRLDCDALFFGIARVIGMISLR